MPKKILFVTATVSESEVLTRVEGISHSGNIYRFGSLEIHPLVTGVGQVATLYRMLKWLDENGRPDIAVNAGIAGSFGEKVSPGDVLLIKNDCFADLGIEDGGEFKTLAESGLASPDEFPLTEGRIAADESFIKLLGRIMQPVVAITVNMATGSEKSCRRLVEKFNPSLETMEGASFFYLCRCESIPFFAIRTVSNRIGPRDRNKWMIKLALENLSARLKEVFLILER